MKARAMMTEAEKRMILDAIPKTWLDPLLTGPKKVLGPYPYEGADIERLLNAIRQRVGKTVAALRKKRKVKR